MQHQRHVPASYLTSPASFTEAHHGQTRCPHCCILHCVAARLRSNAVNSSWVLACIRCSELVDGVVDKRPGCGKVAVVYHDVAILYPQGVPIRPLHVAGAAGTAMPARDAGTAHAIHSRDGGRACLNDSTWVLQAWCNDLIKYMQSQGLWEITRKHSFRGGSPR